MKQFIIVFTTIFVFGQIVFGLDFPSPLQKCRFYDEKCVIDNAQRLIEKYPNGFEAIGFPNLEPLHLDSFNFTGNKDSPANINLYMTNVDFYNFSKATIKKIRGFSKDTTKPMKIVTTAFHPRLDLKSKYKSNGRILILPVLGDGDLEWTILGTDSKVIQNLETEVRDGKTYLKLVDIKVISRSKLIKIHLTNLFNGDVALSENILKVINDNWDVLAAEIQPLVDQELAVAFRKFFEVFYPMVPYDDFFLPDEE